MGMDYTQAAHDYAKYVRDGFEVPQVACVAPQSWLNLPVAAPGIPDRAILTTDYKQYQALAFLLPNTLKNHVLRILDTVIDHQHHLPASHPKGIYSFDGLPPKAIPPNVKSRGWSDSMWMHPDNYLSYHEASTEGTIDYLEHWQDMLSLEDGVLHHQPSRTLYGGDTGVVCVVHPLVDLILNIAVVRVNALDRLTGWIDKWTAAINASTTILQAHSKACCAGLDQHMLQHTEPVYEDPPADDTDTPAVPSPTNSTTRKQDKHKSKGMSKGKQCVYDDDVEPSDASNSDCGEELDFDQMDKRSQDDEDSEGSYGDWEQRVDGIRGNRSADPSMVTKYPILGEDEDDQDDHLGLRFKYRFTEDNTYEEDRENNAGTTSVPARSLSGSSPSTVVFGPFADLPPFMETHFHSPHALVRQLRRLEVECQETIQCFNAYMVANPRIMPSMSDTAQAQAANYPTNTQALYHLLFLHQSAWTHAEIISKCIHGFAQRMVHLLREGCQLHITTQ
ncbi:hypothetical protein OPQ81_011099 [Rhizoctonia solani]|nr:hypothetical protein OPQ81_011099 [Rhizoctonia solani]